MAKFPLSASTRVIFLMAIVTQYAPAARAESVMIKRKFEPGSKQYVESAVEVKQKISGTPMGDMNIDVRRVYGLWETVESVEGDVAEVRLTFDRAAQWMDFPMWNNPYFDSDDPHDPDAAELLRRIYSELIDKSINLKIKDAEIVEFGGLDEIREYISRKIGTNFIWQQMSAEFTNEQGKQNWEEALFQLYPEKEIKVGETWDSSATAVHPKIGTTRTDFTYKLDRFTDKGGRRIAVITYDAKVDTVHGNEQPDPNAAELSGTTEGEALYDVQAGVVVSDHYTNATQIKMPIPGTGSADQPPQFMNVEVRLNADLKRQTPEARAADKAEARSKAEARAKAEQAEEDEEKVDDEDEDEDDD